MDYVNIKLPFEAADSYYNQNTRDTIDQFIYLEESWFKKLFEPTTFYLLGPKGSGKTLYAAYMCTKKRNNTISKQYRISVDDYGKLIEMKKNKHLQYTDYTTMWKVVLLQKFLFGIESNEITWYKRRIKFTKLKATISKHFGNDVADDSFNPVSYIDSYEKQIEITKDIKHEASFNLGLNTFVGSLKSALGNNNRIQNTTDHKNTCTASIYTDTWMRSIIEFKKIIESISFNVNHYLFVDGLDVRPQSIDSKEYSECIGALIRAVYEINTEIFGSINRKDKKEFKILALTRTDIFIGSQLVNATSLIHDNCVELNWSYSNEKEFQNSYLYKMINHILGWKEGNEVYPFEQYFGFVVKNRYGVDVDAATYIQRQSRLRPRDIVVLLRLIQEECKRRHLQNPDATVLESSFFRSEYSIYYAEQIRSEMMFRYSEKEIIKIFSITTAFQKRSFMENRFKEFFNNLVGEEDKTTEQITIFNDYHAFLDALYSLDIIGWREQKYRSRRMHWHYREIRAITEGQKLPWHLIEQAREVLFVVQDGVGREIIGVD